MKWRVLLAVDVLATGFLWLAPVARWVAGRRLCDLDTILREEVVRDAITDARRARS